MASRYVPPHRKRDDSDAILEQGEHSPAYQQEAWQALSRTITGIVNRTSADNLAGSATLLFRENIVRGRGLLARSLLRTQQVDPDLTLVLASLTSRVNKELPDVVQLLCRRLVVQWNRAHLRRDLRFLRNVAKFIAALYVFEVVDVTVIYQMILAHLTAESRTDDDIDQAAKLFEETFKAMSDRARAEFHEQVLTPFRDLLAMDSDEDRLSPRAQTILEACLKAVQTWEKVRDEVSYLPEKLILFDLAEQTKHELDLTEKYPTEDHLDRYSFDPAYTAHEEQYEQLRRAILGEDWEVRMLEEVAAAEEAEADEEQGESGDGEGDELYGGGNGEGGNRLAEGGERVALGARSTQPASGFAAGGSGSGGSGPAAAHTQASLDTGKTRISAEERELRKEVYLAMRSSVRADEAVHKILRQMRPQTERTICFMVVEGCCEERSYKRMYGMVAERLCKSNSRFQAFFVESFRERYAGADALTVKQTEYTANIFAHLLRTEAVYWSRILGRMDIIDNDASQRLMIERLLRSLAEEMGMPALVRRLSQDAETEESTRGLFPLDRGPHALERAVNLYAAMGLGELAAPMRGALERLRHGAALGAEHKRPRE